MLDRIKNFFGWPDAATECALRDLRAAGFRPVAEIANQAHLNDQALNISGDIYLGKTSLNANSIIPADGSPAVNNTNAEPDTYSHTIFFTTMGGTRIETIQIKRGSSLYELSFSSSLYSNTPTAEKQESVDLVKWDLNTGCLSGTKGFSVLPKFLTPEYEDPDHSPELVAEFKKIYADALLRISKLPASIEIKEYCAAVDGYELNNVDKKNERALAVARALAESQQRATHVLKALTDMLAVKKDRLYIDDFDYKKLIKLGEGAKLENPVVMVEPASENIPVALRRRGMLWGRVLPEASQLAAH